MKHSMFTRTISLILTLLLLCTLCACAAPKDSGGGYYGGAKGEGGALGEMDEAAPEGEENGAQEGQSQLRPPAGLITAGAWNDNDHYDLWKPLFEKGQSPEETGKFQEYLENGNFWHFNSLGRIKITVKNGDEPVAGAKVTCQNADGQTIFSAICNAAGVAHLFPKADTGSITITGANKQQTVPFTAETGELTVDLQESVEKKNVIELMFVIDVTGSMGDELSFLQNEIADVVHRIAGANENVTINLALLFYRDHSDDVVFDYCDFVNVSEKKGLDQVIKDLQKRSASGGGDFPEAVDEALEMAVNKQWSTAATTKIIFQVLDAPPHETASNTQTMHAAVMTAAQKGIRICPIICSGADTLTEYVMREAAIQTGGTFVFVTDDSGIGNAHHDPQLPDVTVEALNSLMVRLINGYHSGTFAQPVDWRQEVKQ